MHASCMRVCMYMCVCVRASPFQRACLCFCFIITKSSVCFIVTQKYGVFQIVKKDFRAHCVCVRVYAYVCVCVYVCTYVRTYVCTRIHAQGRTFMCSCSSTDFIVAVQDMFEHFLRLCMSLHESLAGRQRVFVVSECGVHALEC